MSTTRSVAPDLCVVTTTPPSVSNEPHCRRGCAPATRGHRNRPARRGSASRLNRCAAPRQARPHQRYRLPSPARAESRTISPASFARLAARKHEQLLAPNESGAIHCRTHSRALRPAPLHRARGRGARLQAHRFNGERNSCAASEIKARCAERLHCSRSEHSARRSGAQPLAEAAQSQAASSCAHRAAAPRSRHGAGAGVRCRPHQRSLRITLATAREAESPREKPSPRKRRPYSSGCAIWITPSSVCRRGAP